MIHLRMTGQVLIAEAGAARPAHTHVVMHLDPLGDHARHELWFVDPRTFGEVVVFDPTNVAVELPELATLGVDPIAGELTLPMLRRMLRSRHRLLKPMLLDQHVIAGIGNIYADEILHEARLRPDRMSRRARPGGREAVARRDPPRARRRHRRRRLDPRRQPVRRPVRRMGLVPGGSQGLRPHRRTLPDLRRRLDPALDLGPTLHPLLPSMPALNACWTARIGRRDEGRRRLGPLASGPPCS